MTLLCFWVHHRNSKARNIKNDYHFHIKDPVSFQKELPQNCVNVKNWKTIFIYPNHCACTQKFTLNHWHKPLLGEKVSIDSTNPDKSDYWNGLWEKWIWSSQVSILYHPYPTLSVPLLLKALCSFNIKSRGFSFNISCDFP